MAKKKYPYRGYTESEVFEMENGYFLLQFGGDFVLQDGIYLFTQKEVSKIYNDTLKRLVNVMNNGSKKDKKYATDLIGSLVIKKMRLH